MGDRLGTAGAVGFLFFFLPLCVQCFYSAEYFSPMQVWRVLQGPVCVCVCVCVCECVRACALIILYIIHVSNNITA